MDQRPIPSSSSHPTLCRNGCGFFGNPATDGMCSKCYRDSEAGKTERQTRTSSAPGSSNGTRGHSPFTSDSTAKTITNTTSSTPEQTGELTATLLSSLPAASSSTTSTPSSAAVISLSPSSPPTTTARSPKKNRCFTCKKKVGLTGFVCRCGQQFCSLHRYADTHQCTYDYKTSGREELEKHHPKIVAAKIDKL